MADLKAVDVISLRQTAWEEGGGGGGGVGTVRPLQAVNVKKKKQRGHSYMSIYICCIYLRPRTNTMCDWHHVTGRKSAVDVNLRSSLMSVWQD